MDFSYLLKAKSNIVVLRPCTEHILAIKLRNLCLHILIDFRSKETSKIMFNELTYLKYSDKKHVVSK